MLFLGEHPLTALLDLVSEQASAVSGAFLSAASMQATPWRKSG